MEFTSIVEDAAIKSFEAARKRFTNDAEFSLYLEWAQVQRLSTILEEIRAVAEQLESNRGYLIGWLLG